MFLKLSRKLFIGLFLIPFLSYGKDSFVSVCDRTPIIRDAIMKKIAEAEIYPSIECSDDDLTRLILSEFTHLSAGGIFHFISAYLLGISSYDLKAGDLSGMDNLHSLSLIALGIKSLPEDFFSHTPNLLNINLAGNELKSLSEDTFSDVPHLKYLDLFSNELELLPDSIFSHTPDLSHLFLGRNKLKFLPDSLFSVFSTGIPWVTVMEDGEVIESSFKGDRFLSLGENPFINETKRRLISLRSKNDSLSINMDSGSANHREFKNQAMGYTNE